MSVFGEFPDAWDASRLLLQQIQARADNRILPPPPYGRGTLAALLNLVGLPEAFRPMELSLINNLPCPSEDDWLSVRSFSLANDAASFYKGGLPVFSPPIYNLALDMCRVEGSVLPNSFGGEIWTGEKLTPDQSWAYGLDLADKLHKRDPSQPLVGIQPDPIEGAQWLKSHLHMKVVFEHLPPRYKDIIKSRAHMKGPLLVINSMCDFKQYRVAPRVQLQVGKHASALMDGEYLFGSRRIEEGTKKFYGQSRNGFNLVNVPEPKPLTGIDFSFGTQTQYHREMMEAIQAFGGPHLVANIRFPDQWMDVSISACVRAHALANKDIHTLVVTSGLNLPALPMIYEGVLAVSLHRVTGYCLNRLARVLATKKLEFDKIVVAIPPVLGGINLMPEAERFESTLGPFGPIEFWGQNKRVFPRDILFFGRLSKIGYKLQKLSKTKTPMTLGFGDYLKIIREESPAWPREEQA